MNLIYNNGLTTALAYEKRVNPISRYGSSVKSNPQKIDKIQSSESSISGWYYAFEDETVKLKLNETYVLGVYRESKGNSLRTYSLQDENDVKKMITDDHLVYLLKLKIYNK